MPEDEVELTLEQSATHLLEECRMVLPGIQALFGFQLIAVFSERFACVLRASEQLMHLGAILCVVLAIALVMAPAAIQRLREPRQVSRRFVDVCSRLLMWSMVPLAVATTVEVYLVGRVVAQRVDISIGAAAVTIATFVACWILLPTRLRIPRSFPT